MMMFSKKNPSPVFHEASASGRVSRLSLWLSLALIAVLLLFVGALVAAHQALTGILDGREALARVSVHVRSLELSLALDDLTEAQASLEHADRSLAFLSPLRFLPAAGDSYRALRALAHAGAVSSRTFARTLETGLEALELMGEQEDLFRSSNKKGELLARWTSLDRETRLFILTRMKTRLPELEVARNDLSLTLLELEDAIGNRTHPALQKQKEAFAARLHLAEGYLETFVQGMTLLSSLSDEDGGRVLLLFLNDNELRPGGGFLGSFGILTLDAGVVADLTTYDVMAVDGPVLLRRTLPPPEPLAEYLDVPAWFVRDANWSPDFAVSSERILSFFAEELRDAGAEAVIDPNVEFDAVVGLTTSVTADFLSVLGDVEVGGERFTSENIADALENAVQFTFENRGVTHERRKDVIQDIANVMRERFADLSLEEWSRIFTSVAVRLRDKHLMFYSPDADIERLFARQDWGGRAAENFHGDYLMVVDANLAALKTDPAVHRNISYKLDRNGDDLMATVTVVYDHTAPFGPKMTRYRTFTRLYVPEGSELISVEGSLANDALNNPARASDKPVVATDLGKRVFGVFTSVEPLTRGELVFRYRLPERLRDAMDRGSYDLLVQKQLGARNHALTLDLNFDTKLKRATPAETEAEWGDERYTLNTILDQDVSFNIDL